MIDPTLHFRDQATPSRKPKPRQVLAQIQTTASPKRDTAGQAKMRKAANRGERARSESGGVKR